MAYLVRPILPELNGSPPHVRNDTGRLEQTRQQAIDLLCIFAHGLETASHTFMEVQRGLIEK